MIIFNCYVSSPEGTEGMWLVSTSWPRPNLPCPGQSALCCGSMEGLPAGFQATAGWGTPKTQKQISFGVDWIRNPYLYNIYLYLYLYLYIMFIYIYTLYIYINYNEPSFCNPTAGSKVGFQRCGSVPVLLCKKRRAPFPERLKHKSQCCWE